MAGCIRAPRSGQGSVDDVRQAPPPSMLAAPHVTATAATTTAVTPRHYKAIIQVYTDWANHYLEKGASKRRIQDLQRDVSDGVLLADVIEAATSQKIADINRKPKTSAQMTDNIRVSLNFLGALGVAVEGLHAKDVRDGNLKTILGLFYALSRFKQQQKQMPRLPSPFHRAASGGVVTGIPTPKRLGGAAPAGSAGSSRSTSPLAASPQPNNVGRTTPPRPARSPYGVAAPDVRATYIPATPDSRGSMLDKLKLFQRPDKNKIAAVSGSKRTSSSSGVSSARSERSDSSASLCGEAVRQSSSLEKEAPVVVNSSSPKSLARGLRNRLKGGPGGSPKRSSPKVGRKSDVGAKPLQKPTDTASDLEISPKHGKKEESPLVDVNNLHQRQIACLKRETDVNVDRISVDYTVPYDSHNSPKQSKIANFKRDVNAASIDRNSVEYVSPVDAQNNPKQSKLLSFKRDDTASRDRSSVEYTSPVDTQNSSKQTKISSFKRDSDRSSAEYTSPVDCHNSPKQNKLSNLKRDIYSSSTDGSSAEYTSPVEHQCSPKQNKPSNFKRDIHSTSVDEVEYTSPIDSLGSTGQNKISNLKQETANVSMQGITSPSSPHDVPSPAPGDGFKLGKADGSGIPKPMAAVRGTTKVALVAPMPADTMSESSHSNSTGQSNSSEGSVIYRPSSESSSDVPAKEDCVRPMEPLLRGYTRPLMMRVTTRPIKTTHNIALTQGYMSDSEARRVSLENDTGDGYISEGGASLLARKIINSLDCDGGLYSRGRVEEGVSGSGQGSHSKRLVRVGPSSPSQGRNAHNQPQVVYRVVSSRVKKADSSQQTDNSSFRASQSSQWRKYTDVARVPEAHKYSEAREKFDVNREKYGDLNRVPDLSRDKYGGLSRGQDKYGDLPDLTQEKYGEVNRVPELTRGKSDLEVGRSKGRSAGSSHGRRLDKSQSEKSSTHRKQSMRDEGYCNGLNGDCGKQSKVRGVPHSFGYVKRGSPTAPGGCKGEPRTAQVSAVPRTKVKVSGGTQTCSELHHYKSYSLTGPSASQLSQSVRERLLLGSLSLPHWRSRQDGSLSDSSWRVRQTDGSLSDCTYTDLHEAESLESLSSLPAMLQHRASLTHARLALHSRESPRLNRSNSIRSTKSEKLYPSMLERGEEEPYYCLSSGPTSPTLLGGSASSYALGRHKTSEKPSRDDDIHGSSLSLVSTASSLYSTPEEKQAHEIRKLRRELQDANEKVHTLTSQLSTNAHVVSAFEQSLSNMTQRLQQLTASAERKDAELAELRQTVELLRQQTATSLPRRHTINTSVPSGELSRQLSADSVSSLSSACSGSSSHRAGKKKKKGWLRSSFGRAFSRSKRNKHGSVSDVEDFREVSAPGSPSDAPPAGGALKASVSSSALFAQGDEVDQLRKQLREKDLVLTDIRLEALSSAHQLESLKDTVIKMRDEMLDLKRDNERLQRLLGNQQPQRYSQDMASVVSCTTTSAALSNSTEGDRETIGQQRVIVSAQLDGGGECVVGAVLVCRETTWDGLDNSITHIFKEYLNQVDPGSGMGIGVPFNYQLGSIARKLEASSPDGQAENLEPVPWDCLEGNKPGVLVSLKGAGQGSVDALAFDTLIPKSIMHRYVSLLIEHRRIILCGPSGTGKTHLAQRLAEHLVTRDGHSLDSVATFNVDHQSGKELRQYLSHVADQCETNAADLPSVIILDNLHHAASLGEVFNGFLSAKYAKCPYIIGTMNQATCSTTNLQLHHNFRWVLCANHMEPVKGFLGRYLRRRLISTQVCQPDCGPGLARVMDWIPTVWQHLNRFLETHSSSDVTVGPRLFLNCPADCMDSQVWFTDLWNYSLVPYLLEAVREGLQLYGRRAAWEDPANYVLQTYPWAEAGPSLLRLRPEDVGYGQGVGSSSVKSLSSAHSDTEGDPLLNMLMRLQEAANYSSPPSNDSDSVDSHSTDKEGRVESTL